MILSFFFLLLMICFQTLSEASIDIDEAFLFYISHSPVIKSFFLIFCREVSCGREEKRHCRIQNKSDQICFWLKREKEKKLCFGRNKKSTNEWWIQKDSVHTCTLLYLFVCSTVLPCFTSSSYNATRTCFISSFHLSLSNKEISRYSTRIETTR